MTTLHLLQAMDMESPGFSASACAWVMMCSMCNISCAPFISSAARAAMGSQTPNAKATASPELRLILLRMFCSVFITLSFFLLVRFLFVVAANVAFANLLHWLLSFVGVRRLHINVVSNQPPGLLVIG